MNHQLKIINPLVIVVCEVVRASEERFIEVNYIILQGNERNFKANCFADRPVQATPLIFLTLIEQLFLWQFCCEWRFRDASEQLWKTYL